MDADMEMLLRRQADRVKEAEDGLRALVAQARANHATWTEIGNAFGTTRQSAWERFGKKGGYVPGNLYDVALRATDSVMGDGTYADMNKSNPDPGVQAAITRWRERRDDGS